MLHLVFAGDIMGHDVNYRMADYRDIYRGVRQYLGDADLAVANLELPVDPTRAESGYPRFNGNAAYVRAAVEAGFNLLSTANNHAFDGRGGGGAADAAWMAGSSPAMTARGVWKRSPRLRLRPL